MKLIKLNPDHFVIVDDSEIKEGDFVYDSKDKVIRFVKQYLPDEWIKKITHSTQPLELVSWENGVLGKRPAYDKIKKISVEEVKELIGEVDVEKKANMYFDKEMLRDLNDPKKREFNFHWKKHYISGYTQAIEDNKDKKYTEEDLIIIFGLGAANRANGKPSLQEAIQTLQPKTEWNVTFNKQNKLQLI